MLAFTAPTHLGVRGHVSFARLRSMLIREHAGNLRGVCRACNSCESCMGRCRTAAMPPTEMLTRPTRDAPGEFACAMAKRPV
eukprot:2560797-Pleurochrysis_carterae.AAC.1